MIRIARNIRIRPIRRTLRRGELSKGEKTAMRLKVYEDAEGLCELKLHAECIGGILELDGYTPWDHGHLVHMKSTGSGGKWNRANLRWGCHNCHLISLHNPKSVPPKR